MAHGTHGAEGMTSERPRLLYGLNDKPPVRDSLFVALQHVCAIFILVVTPGLLIAASPGLCFFGSFIPIIMSRFLPLTQKIFTPLLMGTAVTLIGLCLIEVESLVCDSGSLSGGWSRRHFHA